MLGKTIKAIKMEAANASHTPAPESTITVAPFQAWRSSQCIVARGPAKATITIDANDNRHVLQTSITPCNIQTLNIQHYYIDTSL